MKYIGTRSAVRSGLLASSVMLLIATFAGTPAFAKSDAKKSKPEKARVERPSSGDSSTRFTAVYGTKTLNKTDWAPAENQTGFGLDVEYVNEDWPVSVLGYYFTGKGGGPGIRTRTLTGMASWTGLSKPQRQRPR